MLCNGVNYQALGNDLENGCPMSLLVCHVKKTTLLNDPVLNLGLKLKPSGSTKWHLHICSNKILRRDKNNNQSWRDWDCFYFAVDTEWKLKVLVLTIDAPIIVWYMYLLFLGDQSSACASWLVGFKCFKSLKSLILNNSNALHVDRFHTPRKIKHLMQWGICSWEVQA